MRLDRTFDDVQPGYDLCVGQPSSHQSDHVALAASQAFQPRSRPDRTVHPATPVEVCDDAVGYLRREVCGTA